MKFDGHLAALVAASFSMCFAAAPAAAQSNVGAPDRAAASPGQGAFGGSVAVAGDQVLVGEPLTILRPGTVWVYERAADGTWTEASSFTAPGGQPEDRFGTSMDVDGDRLLVGADGAVHEFRRAGGSWTHVATLTAAAGDADDFGASVALAGDWALVGAPERADEAGAAWLFRRAGDGWTEVEMLGIEPAESDAAFGSAVALHGATALVGAEGSRSRRGRVVAYTLSEAGAERTGVLEAAGGGRGDRFGASIAVEDDMLVVGAPGLAGEMGAVYAFTPAEDGGWELFTRLLPFDGESRMGFGTAVVLDGDATWVGAPGSGWTGAVYRFWADGGGSAVRRIAPADGLAFAGAMAVAGDVAVFGLPAADHGAGQASIFAATGDGRWSEASRVMSEIESYEAVTGGEVRCAGGSASAFECGEVDLVAFLPTSEMGGSRGVETNDVWGWTDPATGREYALVGMMDATSFVDISDPANPVYVGKLPMTEGSYANIWRDMKVYDGHAFVVADGAGEHGVQIFDLTRLRDFDGTPEVFDEDALYEGVASVHNIAINEETGMAYAVGSRMGGETCGGGLHMIDVRDPKKPTFAGCFADPQTGRASTGYSHDAQCVTYHGPDEAFQGREICLGANETALSVADVTDPENPVAVARASYPNVGYSHQGWLTEDHRYFYMNDELDEIQGRVERTRTLIWDLGDLEDPQLVAEYFGSTESSDHNLYVVGDRLYQSNYQSGFRILDISDRENPVEIGFFDTVPYGTNTPGMAGSWSNYPFFESGVVIVTSGREGLFILRPADRDTIS